MKMKVTVIMIIVIRAMMSEVDVKTCFVASERDLHAAPLMNNSIMHATSAAMKPAETKGTLQTCRAGLAILFKNFLQLKREPLLSSTQRLLRVIKYASSCN